LAEAVKRLGLKANIKDPADMAGQVTEYFAKMDPRHLLTCDSCGGDSDNTFDVCPYCGDSSCDQSPPEETVAVPKKKLAAPKKKTAAPTLALVSPQEVPSEIVLTPVFTESELDKAVEHAIELKHDTQRSVYRLAKHVTHIYETQMWKARRIEGASKYNASSGFGRFIVEEVGITPQWAYQLMDMAKAFSEEDVAAIGPTKLTIILLAPKESREKILEMVRDGDLSTSDVKELVSSEREEKGAPNRNEESGRRGTGSKGDTLKPKEKKILVAQMLGHQTIELFKKKTFAKKTKERATALADVPVGELWFENYVKMKFELRHDAAGNFFLYVDVERPTDE
jgi:hypothetical protein